MFLNKHTILFLYNTLPAVVRIPGGAAGCWPLPEMIEVRCCWMVNSFSELVASSLAVTDDSIWFRYFSTAWLLGADNGCVADVPVKFDSAPKSGWWWWCFMRRSTTPAPGRTVALGLFSVGKTPFVSLRRWGLRTWAWADSCIPIIE